MKIPVLELLVIYSLIPFSVCDTGNKEVSDISLVDFKDIVKKLPQPKVTGGSLHDVPTICFDTNFDGYKFDNQSLLRVCYYTDFSPAPSQLNVSLCTHIIAGFANIKDGMIDIENNITLKEWFRNTTNLKQYYPELKVLLTVGGGGNNNGFSPACDCVKNRTRFIASALTVLNDYNFDGLDIDWEFPVWNDYVLEDKENFISFLKEFKFGAALYASMTGKTLLLSVAVGAPKTIVDKAYNIPEMAKYVDFINLMSYDFHDYFWYTPFTGHNSPLFRRSVEQSYFATLNTAWSALYWNQLGMPKSKIIVGIPTYAHTYTLLDPDMNGVDAPAVDVGMNGGDISFTAVCNFLSSGAVRVFDNESQVPYAYKDYDWVSFEDETSILGKTFNDVDGILNILNSNNSCMKFTHKMDNNEHGLLDAFLICNDDEFHTAVSLLQTFFGSLHPHEVPAQWIKQQSFGGAMTYNLNNDDWSSACNSLPFPLHTIIYNVFTR